MKLIESPKQLTRRRILNGSTIIFRIPKIVAIEKDLSRLSSLFITASFILAEHDVKRLSYLCRMHAQVKMELRKHFQDLKLNPIEARQVLLKHQMKLNTSLELEILNLRSQIDKFISKLFRESSGKRRPLL